MAAQAPLIRTTEIVTRDGARLRLRPIQPDDGERLQRFHSGLSDETVYRRFFSAHPKLSVHEVERFTHVDGRDRVALVVLDDGEIVAVGRYDREGGKPVAEVAFVVADRYQRRGIGTALLRELDRVASSHGIETFTAQTLFMNAGMRRVFAGAGYQVKSTLDCGVVSVEFPIGERAAGRAE